MVDCLISMVTKKRDTKVKFALLFIVIISLTVVYYNRQSFVDWSDVEKIAEYPNNATIGDTVKIHYYLENTKPHDIKVKPRTEFSTSFHYASNPDIQTTSQIAEDYGVDYLAIKSKSREYIHTETIEASQLGTLYVQVSGLPDAEILILPKGYNYSNGQSSPPDQFELLTEFLPIETVVDDWWDRGLKVFLPLYLPNNIEPQGVWTHGADEGLGSFAVFVFSAYNRTDVATAEIIICVSDEDKAFEKNKSWGMTYFFDFASAYVELSVPVSYHEYLEMYGPYSTRVQIRIFSMYYLMRVEPSILLGDIKEIIWSLIPITDL